MARFHWPRPVRRSVRAKCRSAGTSCRSSITTFSRTSACARPVIASASCMPSSRCVRGTAIAATPARSGCVPRAHLLGRSRAPPAHGHVLRLVGSTELAHRLDPEDLRELIIAYQDVCRAAVKRYEGFVARYVGDGVLAYFGFPQAHEEDAERAVRAGLRHRRRDESVGASRDAMGSDCASGSGSRPARSSSAT